MPKLAKQQFYNVGLRKRVTCSKNEITYKEFNNRGRKVPALVAKKNGYKMVKFVKHKDAAKLKKTYGK